jgi:hypothetical protein
MKPNRTDTLGIGSVWGEWRPRHPGQLVRLRHRVENPGRSRAPIRDALHCLGQQHNHVVVRFDDESDGGHRQQRLGRWSQEG